MGVVKGSTVNLSADLARRQETTISSTTSTNETLPTLEPTMTARLGEDIAVRSPDADATVDTTAAAGWSDVFGMDVVIDKAVDESPGNPDDDDDSSAVGADEEPSTTEVLTTMTSGVHVSELESCPTIAPAGDGGLGSGEFASGLGVTSSTVLRTRYISLTSSC